jgi:glucose 1-dehydrogenase
MPLSDKRILVTGSSQGIGLAVAQALAAQNAAVMMTSERELTRCPAVQRLLDQYPRTRYIQANILDDQAPEKLVDQTWDTLGGIDVLINNVGTYQEPAFGELTRKQFDFIFGLNVWSVIAVTQAMVKRAKEVHRGGRILFTTSLNATRSEPAHTLYDASKGAINALTRQLAIELAPWGFTTAAVAPGLVETPLTDFGLRSDPQSRLAIEEQIPIHKIATVDQIASWFVFLSRDAANYATGIVIPVDGGLDAQQMPTRPITNFERKI